LYKEIPTAEVRRQSDALVGKHDPSHDREATPEEKADLALAEIDVERWNQLEKATLMVNAETVRWAKQKQERLRKYKLPAQDHRPAQLSSFLTKARHALPEAT
jgi:hypothetical protein